MLIFKFNNKYFYRTIVYLLYLVIFYLVIRELTNSYNSLADVLKKFSYQYIFIAFFFSILAIFLNSYALFLIYKTQIKLNFFFWNLKLYNSMILDHIPFLGTFYRAKKLKKEYNLRYHSFISILFFAININFFLVLLLINIFLIYQNTNFLEINFIIFNIFLMIYLIFIVFLNYSTNFQSFFLKLFKLINLSKIYVIFLNFLDIQINLFKNKMFILKILLYFLVSHVLNFLFLFFIFKAFNINIEYYTAVLIYLFHTISTLVKILPKNYVISESIGAYLLFKASFNFANGFLIFVLYRVLQLFSIFTLFLIFNSYKIKKTNSNV